MPDQERFADRRARLSPAKRALLERRLQGDLSPLPAQAATGRMPRRPDPDHLPLSFAQERFWYLNQLLPGQPVYNRPLALRLRGPLDIPALEQSLIAIVQRHQVLRATFTSVDGRPVQAIADPRPLSLPVVNLDDLPLPERETHARRLAVLETHRPFDLARGPLLRASLLRLDEGEHWLVLVVHHIAFDGWSARVALRELATLYEAFSAGQPSPLPELPIQYADWAHWQRQPARDQFLQAQLAYWQATLAAPLPVLELPADRPRPATPTHRGARHLLTLPSSLVDALEALSRREGVTLFMTLLAAFQALLHRYTGHDDLVVGTPVAGRTHLETEGLIGFLVNTLVLRADLSGNPPFRDLLQRVRQRTLDAYAHQDLPFERLVEALQPERHLNRTPLFQVLFNLENVPPVAATVHGLAFEEVELDSGTATFDLSLELAERDGALGCTFQYSLDLFDAATIARMAGHYHTLLQGIAAEPGRRLSDLPLLSAAERHQLLVEWNDTCADVPAPGCIHERFETQAKRSPDAVALVFEDHQLTYRQLNARANQLAHYLHKRGVGPETRVGLCVERSLEMGVGLLAILKAGGAYVPLDPAYPPQRLALMLEDAAPLVVLTQQHLQAHLPPSVAHVICLDADWRRISAESEHDPAFPADPAQAAYVIFTSGSTGRPKGVVVEHRSVVNLLAAVCQAVPALAPRPERPLRQTFNASITFDASVKQISQLLHGHTLFILPDEIRADGQALLAFLRRHRIDVLDCVPAQLELLLAAGLLEQPSQAPRLVLVGGEAIDPNTWRRMAAATGVRFYNVYGPTECTVATTIAPISNAHPRPIIGRPIANVQVYLLDPHRNPVPVGVPGELYVGGAGLARGYLRRPALTAERFIPNPFSHDAGARLYRTGDWARYLPDGNIEFLGRFDHQVKLRGFRVELGEIESVLARHPAVRAAVALVHRAAPTDDRLVAYVVPCRPGVGPTPSDLRRFLQEWLPDHMLPSAFVFLESLPRTPAGKVDRQALPAPDAARPALDEAFVAPRTELERLLAGIWQELLGLDRVGVYDNFFDLGGHSLLSLQAIARMEQRLGVRINPWEMIRQTLGQLAALYEEKMQRVQPPAPLHPGRKLWSAIRRVLCRTFDAQ
jgi:amino acid adenylation domain-containing protein